MTKEPEELKDLLQLQISRLGYSHFLVLYWCAIGEGMGAKYNITNCFDDLKHCSVTRTKQTAVSVIETLHALGYVDVRDEHNRKNIYITHWGAKALQQLVLGKRFEVQESIYLTIVNKNK